MSGFDQDPRAADFVQDPYPAYGRLRAAGRFVHWPALGLPCTGHADLIDAALRDRRLGRAPPPGHEPPRPDHLADFWAIEDNALLELEPPEHTRLRSLVLRAFTSRRVAALEDMIAALAHDLIDRFEGPEVDLLPAFAERLPVIVIARALGVPEIMADQLRAWSHAMVAVYQARRDRGVEDAANAAARDFSLWLRGLIAERRRAPRDDLVSDLVAARDRADRLSEAELIATVVLLLNAGHEATVHAIGNGVKAMLDSGLPIGPMLAGPAAIAATIEEILRFDPPLHLFTRWVREPLTLGGRDFVPGDRLGLVLGAAGRDPAATPDPDRFDPGRATGRHLAFGAGIHFCIGAPLARAELSIALPILFQRLPRLALAGRPVYADRWHFRGLKALPVTIA